DGKFSFVLFVTLNGNFLLGRDHVGLTQLYYAQRVGVWYVASELKALTHVHARIETLAPGTLFDGKETFRYVSYDASR
ncbi:asparagine synthetase B, partial [Burkholderia pseudomallei]